MSDVPASQHVDLPPVRQPPLVVSYPTVPLGQQVAAPAPEATEDRATFTVAVAGVGWAYTATLGVPVDPEAATVLCSPFTWEWELDRAQLPGHAEPEVVRFTLASRSAAGMPSVQIGDVVTLEVHLGTPNAPGTILKHLTAARVTSVEADVDPHRDYPIAQTVIVTDQLADVRSSAPTIVVTGNMPATNYVRELLAQAGDRIPRSIGCPDWWPDDLLPGTALGDLWPDENGLDLLRRFLNSAAPSGIHHTVVSHVGPGYPPGFKYVGLGAFSRPTISYSDPGTTSRLLLVPCSRYDPAGVSHVDVAAGWCQVPATARKGREHAINTAVIEGQEVKLTPPPAGSLQGSFTNKLISYELPNADAYSTGKRARKVPTMLRQGVLDLEDHDLQPRPAPGVVLAGRVFRADPSSLYAAPWSFGELTVYASDMPPAYAAAVLPKLAPQLPGSHPGSDGQLVRHVSITGLPAVAQLTGFDSLSGFLVAGSLQVNRGELTYSLTLTPGEPMTTSPHNIGP